VLNKKSTKEQLFTIPGFGLTPFSVRLTKLTFPFLYKGRKLPSSPAFFFESSYELSQNFVEFLAFADNDPMFLLSLLM
jgi:hypothetical protein